MKKLILFFVFLIVTFNIIDNVFLNNTIKNSIISYFNKNSDFNLVINENSVKNNKYYYNDLGSDVKTTTNFYPSNKKELLNVYYTFLNSGFDNFIYYCNINYSECFNDIKEISEDANTFSYINQLVHPYNSFKEINSKYNKLIRRVDIETKKKYTDDDITKIDNKIDEIVNTLNINNTDDIKTKILLFHDYLANSNKYDKAKEYNNSTYNSDTAIGPLFEGYSICSGYSDAMAIFLNRLGLENIKIITEKHTWNAVKINNVWYHIDITWDDPIVTNGEDIITHDYFLITTDELLKKDLSEHNFDKGLYSFIK